MIPKQASEAAELAEQLFEQMNSKAPAEEETTEALGDEGTVSEEPDVTPEEEADVPHDDDVNELRKFKERYLSLKGKYDAEVPRLHSELKEFKQNVFDKLNTITTQPKQEETQAPVVSDRLSKFREDYGDDFVETIRELLKTEINPLLKESLAPVQQHVSSVEDTQIKAAQQNFMGYLDNQVKGDWKQLWSGNDPKFLEFLSQPDPSGLYTYGELVQAYNDKWDADKLTKVFNTYFDANAPPVKVEQKPNPAKEAMVAPSRNTPHTTPASTDKRIWTKDAIEEFQREDRRGKFSSEDSMAMWNDLLAAASDGRIR
jgi:hypothetical protein